MEGQSRESTFEERRRFLFSEKEKRKLTPEEEKEIYLIDLNSLRLICLSRVHVFQNHVKYSDCYADVFYCTECILCLFNDLESKRDITSLKNYLSTFLKNPFCSCSEAEAAIKRAESLHVALAGYLQKF